LFVGHSAVVAAGSRHREGIAWDIAQSPRRNV
jgi:hypothetical protein